MTTTNISNHVKDFDSRFSCGICLMPALEMVYGRCQHRICASCLYQEDNVLRTAFKLCPFCFMQDTFAPTRPAVPEDMKVIQNLLGVRKCPYEECTMCLWEWDIEEHVRNSHTDHTSDQPCDSQVVKNAATCEPNKKILTSSTPGSTKRNPYRRASMGVVRRRQPSRKANSVYSRPRSTSH